MERGNSCRVVEMLDKILICAGLASVGVGMYLCDQGYENNASVSLVIIGSIAIVGAPVARFFRDMR